MEEIKANEILRAENGKFYKIVSSTKDDFMCIELGKNKAHIELLSNLPEIVKHSESLIDLIEEGDYVNGKKIDVIIKGNWKSEGVAERVLCFETDFPIEKGLRAYHDCDIKSIVTKEAFASAEYIINLQSNKQTQ